MTDVIHLPDPVFPGDLVDPHLQLKGPHLNGCKHTDCHFTHPS